MDSTYHINQSIKGVKNIRGIKIDKRYKDRKIKEWVKRYKR